MEVVVKRWTSSLTRSRARWSSPSFMVEVWWWPAAETGEVK